MKKSQIPGVYWKPKIKRWVVEMRVKGLHPKKMYCGCFQNKVKAEEKAIEIRNNFPKQKHGQPLFISSKTRGVYLKGSTFQARISIKNIKIYLGTFKNKILAIFAYNAAARLLYGEDAIINETEVISG